MDIIFDGQLEALNNENVTYTNSMLEIVHDSVGNRLISETSSWELVVNQDIENLPNLVKNVLIPLLKRGPNVMFNMTIVSGDVRHSFQGCKLEKVNLDGRFTIGIGSYVDM